MYLANILNPEGLVIILVVVLILFGGKKIPELMRGVGKGVGELHKGIEEGKKHFEDAGRIEPASTITPTPSPESHPRGPEATNPQS